MGPWEANKKTLSQCGGASSSCRVPSQRPLAPSVASVTSVTNGKGDNEMILGAVHRSPGICLTAKEKPQKTSARRPSVEGAVQMKGPQMESISSELGLTLFEVL